MLNDLTSTFDPLSPVTFRFERLETNPRFAAIARPANAAEAGLSHVEFRAGQMIQKKYGADHVKHVTYPDNFMNEQQTVIAQLVGHSTPFTIAHYTKLSRPEFSDYARRQFAVPEELAVAA